MSKAALKRAKAALKDKDHEAALAAAEVRDERERENDQKGDSVCFRE
jgi:hypothetical protein